MFGELLMTLQPDLSRDNFFRRLSSRKKLLQEVGALQEQQSFGLTPNTRGQAFKTLDQRIASAADQGGEGIQRTNQNSACLRTFKPL